MLSLTASGCVVVRGDLEIVPSSTRGEAARALEEFTTAYNDADKEYDQSRDASRVTGALADIEAIVTIHANTVAVAAELAPCHNTSAC